jgi:hypothetical protein
MTEKLVQNLTLIVQKTRIILLPYKKNYLLRAFVILLVTVVLWFLTNGGFKEGVAYPFIVLWMEYLTINTFFERDAMPGDIAIRNYFGSKDAFGYKFYCVLEFLFCWTMFLVLIFFS